MIGWLFRCIGWFALLRGFFHDAEIKREQKAADDAAATKEALDAKEREATIMAAPKPDSIGGSINRL